LSNQISAKNEEQALLLGRENIGKLLKQFSLPAIAAMVASSLYNIIDGIFIGQGVGAMAIAGLAITFPVMNLSAAFGALVGVGASVLCSISLGEKNYERARLVLGNVIILNLILGLVITILGLIFLDPILIFFGASSQTLPYARDYMVIILIFNVFAHSYLGLNSVLRSSGYPIKAMTLTMITVLINLVLAPLFIFVFHWGIRGAAWATSISEAVGFIILILIFMKRDKIVYIDRNIFHLHWIIIRKSCAIGSASFFTNAAACFVVMFINFGLKKYGGDLAIGAYGIINRISFMIVMIIIGLSQGMQPIVGYNYGARNMERVWKTFRITYIFTTIIAIFGYCLAQFCPYFLSRAFTTDKELIRITVNGFHKNFACFFVVGFQIIGTNFFASISQSKKSIFLSLTRQVIFLIPLLIILPPIMGVNGVWYSAPIADTLATILTIWLILREKRLLFGNNKQ
jgi:putative MATE family efflux protein